MTGMNQTQREETMMTLPGQQLTGGALAVAHAFDIEAAKTRLAADGGYEIIHESAGLEICVYVIVSPEPDQQQPHADDEVYVVLEGSGTLDVEGEQVELREGQAAFVPAGAKHQFIGYEQLSVPAIFEKVRR
jgi:mannose-6-phosphate isomerase-like protein (cupin superfamily)